MFFAIFLCSWAMSYSQLTDNEPSIPPAEREVYSSSSFYVIAHQDDWQLFMGINAYWDMLLTSNKVVFIYLTAGDACLRTTSCLYNIPYYQSREDGAKNSVYLAVDFTSPINCDDFPNCIGRPNNHVVTINNHLITKWHYKNVVKYFLRLPDNRVHFDDPQHYMCGGEIDDSTFLNNFRRGVLSSLSDITGLTTYSSWNDLVTTVKAILINEKVGYSGWINSSDYSLSFNPNTHPDHRESGLIVNSIYSQQLSFHIAYYMDYNTFWCPSNLSDDEIMKETGLFAAYNIGKINGGCDTDWDVTSRKWCLNDSITRSFISTKSYLISGSLTEPPIKVSIFPNPSFKEVTVNLNLLDETTLSCTVINLKGIAVSNILTDQKVNQGDYEFKIKDLPPGFNLIQIKTSQGIVFSEKILCQ